MGGQQFTAWGKRSAVFVLMLWAAVSVVWATHNRAGEITYTHVEGLTYEVLITTYTKSTALADRPWLFLTWGDESGPDLDSLMRDADNILILPGEVQVNFYRGTHTYGGPGEYEIAVEDPNRNDGVLNIEGSVDVPFAIRTLLVINPLAGHNNSVQLLNAAQQNACRAQPWIHNPGAHDPDGDILTYELVPCRGFNGDFIPGYQYPDEISPADDVFAIDASTGDVTWEDPQIVGEYNIAIRIQEWRWVDGGLVRVGEVIRDMQIAVEQCTNEPPVIADVNDTCIVAGTFYSQAFTASDPNGDPLGMTAVGGPISEVEHPAVFTYQGGGNATLNWFPQCDEVRAEPYTVVVKAEDVSTQVDLADLETVSIRVVSPAPEALAAEAVGNAVLVSWLPAECGADLPLWKREQGVYRIYRRVGEDAFEATACQTGVPPEWGYTAIAEVSDLNSTGYVDEDLLAFGATYCYRIVAEWPGSGESIASDPVCATIVKDVPVMTTASVEVTDGSDGEVAVAWSPPTDADTTVFAGPYWYRVEGRRPADGPDWSEVHTSATSPWLGTSDTLFTHAPAGTAASPWQYRVEAWSNNDLIGTSTPATTPWLVLTPNDNRLELTLEYAVPWTNTAFEFFRAEPDGTWLSLGTATEPLWVDSGLVNGTNYCYYAVTTGEYDAPGTLSPIVNRSQEACGRPFDLTPPCAPRFAIEPDCEAATNTLTWSDVPGCADDVMGYTIYWAPFLGDTLKPYLTLEGAPAEPFAFNAEGAEGTIAGCFAVTALDSLMLGPGGELRRNESAFSDTLCADNCPFYFLPNVFSPNGDDRNDRFEAFPWKFIERVDFRVYNRNGEEVYFTEDPSINWGGEHRDGGLCADGVYFYSARVFTIRLEGLVEEQFSGTIQLIDGLPINPE